jgi:hypothetical protein
MKRYLLPVLLLTFLLGLNGGYAFAKAVAWGDYRISLSRDWSLQPIDRAQPHQLIISAKYKGRQAVIVLDKEATPVISKSEYKAWLNRFAAHVKSQGLSNFQFVPKSGLTILGVKRCPVALGEKGRLRHFNFVPYVNGKVHFIAAAVEITPKSRGIPKFVVAALNGIRLKNQPGPDMRPKDKSRRKPRQAGKPPASKKRILLAKAFGVPSAGRVISYEKYDKPPESLRKAARVVNMDGFGFSGLKPILTPGQEIWLGFNRPAKAGNAAAILYRLNADGSKLLVRKLKLNQQRRGMLPLTLPAAAGLYQFAMYDNGGKKANLLAATVFELKPQKGTHRQGLYLPRQVFAPGEFMGLKVRLKIKNPSAWVAMVKSDAPIGTSGQTDRHDIQYQYLSKMKNGVLGFLAPKKPGKYQLRLFGSAQPGALALVSLNFTVKPLNWLGRPIMALNKDKYLVGQTFSIVFNAMPDWHPKSWIALVPAKAPHGDSAINDKYDLSYHTLRKRKVGTARFNAPKKPGVYQLRMIGGPPKGAGRKEVVVAQFKSLLPKGYSKRKLYLRAAKKRYEAYEQIYLKYAARRDWPEAWIGLVPRGTPLDSVKAHKARKGGSSIGGKDEGEITIGAPVKPGAYELRMYAGKKGVTRPRFVLPVQIVPQADEAKTNAMAEKAAEKYLRNLPDYDDLGVPPEKFKHFFRAPSVPLVPAKPTDRVRLEPCLPCQVGEPVMLADNSRVPRIKNGVFIVDDSNSPGFAIRLVGSKEDSACIDREIELMRKLNVTLGHDNKFADALVNMAQTFATKWTVPIKSGKQLNLAINMAVDSYNHGGAAIEAMKKGQYSDAVLQSMTIVLKTLANSCQTAACFKAVSKSADETLSKYWMTLTPGAKARFIHQARQALGNDKFIAKLQSTMNTGMTVDTGTTAVQARSGDFRRAIWTFTSTAVQVHPVGAMVLATGKAGYEGMLAARDMIVDSTTRDLYKAYKKAYKPGGKDAEAVYAGLSRGFAYPYEKVRRMMLANPTNPLVRKAMSEGNRLRALNAGGKRLKADHISHDEIDAFLKLQFKAWMNEERKGSKFADYAKSLKNDFNKLECPHALFKKLDEERKKKSNWQQLKDKVNEFREGSCPKGKRFAAYVKLRSDIDAEMNKWSQGKGCKKLSLRRTSAKLACTFLKNGSQHYQHELNQAAQKCGWRPKVDYWAELHYGNKLAKLSKNEKKVSRILKKIGRKDVLHCLCKRSSGMVSAGYHPQKTKGVSPSCDKGSGSCTGGSWGCMRFSMKTTRKNLKACGAFRAIAAYKKKQGKK